MLACSQSACAHARGGAPGVSALRRAHVIRIQGRAVTRDNQAGLKNDPLPSASTSTVETTPGSSQPPATSEQDPSGSYTRKPTTVKRQADSTDAVASFLTRRFGLAGGERVADAVGDACGKTRGRGVRLRSCIHAVLFTCWLVTWLLYAEDL
jgi:hypothetical protein